MPEFEINSATKAEDLIRLLKANDRVLLLYKDYKLIVTRKCSHPHKGMSTFTEFKWGRDRKLLEYIERGKCDQPWLIRVQVPGSNYDWAWTGGETMSLLGNSGGTVGNCFIVGVTDETDSARLLH